MDGGTVSRPQQITVLGATGSIGLSTLDVIGRHPERYQVFALSGFTRLSELLALCIRHTPRFAVVPQADVARALQDGLQRERRAHIRRQIHETVGRPGLHVHELHGPAVPRRRGRAMLASRHRPAGSRSEK